MRDNGGLSAEEHGNVQQRVPLRAPMVYEIIRRDGVTEIERPLRSLWWSGVSAGLSISASVLAIGLLHLHLPDAEWRSALESLGYCVGFLIVGLGRMQLFTEATITVILPLLAERTPRLLKRTLRLWIVVFVANLVGTFLVSLLIVHGGMTTPEQLTALQAVSMKLASKTPVEALVHGIPAGFFIAAMVWMKPSAGDAAFWVTVVMTYLISLGGFAHVVAGSAEVFILILTGDIGLGHGLLGIVMPAFVGNVVGGTGLFALLAYAQVREEMVLGED